MEKIKVGLLHETKNPPDRRAALTPSTAIEFLEKYPNVELKIQSSKLRAFTDEEYSAKGLTVVDDLSDCDVLLGIKEVDKDTFIANKKYLFFGHVAKKQPHNKELFKSIIKNKLTFIDYEYLTNDKGLRLVAFGIWAGIVGAYNGIRTWGLRTKRFELKPAHKCFDKKEMYEICKTVKLEPIKIVVTGGGRVASGAIETLKAFGIKEVLPKDFLEKEYTEAVYTKLEPQDYVKHKDDKEFDLQHFFDNPTEYESTFEPYTKVADIYISGHFWNPQSPVFIDAEQMRQPDFNIKVVADVSCDIKQPIASTLRSSTISDPFYDYNPQTEKEEKAFSNEKNISVMAIDNLPGELARDTSEYFSKGLIDNIFPYLFGEDKFNFISNATIVENGYITNKYSYLENWIKC